ncbi:hypothetical protein [Asticcacaulis solisilvae]|uniref:hypothetical protein n=1 Tax=Asticcacaulis solisilvae TaxID=1217274 RepID=UPI003FD8EBD6
MKLSVKSLAAAAVLASGLTMAMPSLAAGSASQALGQCMSKSTTPADDIVLVRWVFVMIGKHPGVADLGTVSPEKQDQVDRQMGAVFERLLAKDCAEETRAAMAEDTNNEAIPDAFGVLFEKAFSKLTDDPAVMATAQNFIKYVDMNKIVQAMLPAPGKK